MAAEYPVPIHPVTVSIVLLTYNGMPVVEHCIRMISQQTMGAQIEIIHIDSVPPTAPSTSHAPFHFRLTLSRTARFIIVAPAISLQRSPITISWCS